MQWDWERLEGWYGSILTGGMIKTVTVLFNILKNDDRKVYEKAFANNTNMNNKKGRKNKICL